MIVKVKKLDDRAILPTYGSAYAAGADLYALVNGETLAIAAGDKAGPATRRFADYVVRYVTEQIEK